MYDLVNTLLKSTRYRVPGTPFSHSTIISYVHSRYQKYLVFVFVFTSYDIYIHMYDTGIVCLTLRTPPLPTAQPGTIYIVIYQSLLYTHVCHAYNMYHTHMMLQLLGVVVHTLHIISPYIRSIQQSTAVIPVHDYSGTHMFLWRCSASIGRGYYSQYIPAMLYICMYVHWYHTRAFSNIAAHACIMRADRVNNCDVLDAHRRV